VTGSDARFERLVDATPEAAFRLWNDAESRVRWHKPEDDWIVEASTDLRVGGIWRVASGPSASEMTIGEGVYEIVDTPHLVAYTCTHRVPGRPAFDTRITVTFKARGNRTLVTLVEAEFPDEEQCRKFESGWPAFLGAYVQFILRASA
jgi:uncharacterized protein YndB with AHSA1/START domain